MLKSVCELANELNKINEAYFQNVGKLAKKDEDQGNKELLKSLEPIVINYIYLKSCHDRSIEPDYITAKVSFYNIFIRQTLLIKLCLIKVDYKRIGSIISIMCSESLNSGKSK